MRLWHRGLIKYLPDNQLKGQWRECALIAYSIKKYGTPNHLLVNKVMEYDIDEFLNYCLLVSQEMKNRGFRVTQESANRISALGTYRYVEQPFAGWHNYEYLRVCVCNLYEKYHFGVGKSKITKSEWDRILQGYKEITGEEYKI